MDCYLLIAILGNVALIGCVSAVLFLLSRGLAGTEGKTDALGLLGIVIGIPTAIFSLVNSPILTLAAPLTNSEAPAVISVILPALIGYRYLNCYLTKVGQNGKAVCHLLLAITAANLAVQFFGLLNFLVRPSTLIAVINVALMVFVVTAFTLTFGIRALMPPLEPSEVHESDRMLRIGLWRQFIYALSSAGVLLIATQGIHFGNLSRNHADTIRDILVYSYVYLFFILLVKPTVFPKGNACSANRK